MAELEIVRCANCGASNRVPQDKVTRGLKPVCGRCKTPLVVSNGIVTVTHATFTADVEASTLPVLLELWAPWCGPCRLIAPVVEQLASEMAGRLRVAEMNVDENPLTASRFNVRSIPSLLVLRNGNEVDRIVGTQPKSEIKRRLNAVLA